MREIRRAWRVIESTTVRFATLTKCCINHCIMSPTWHVCIFSGNDTKINPRWGGHTCVWRSCRAKLCHEISTVQSSSRQPGNTYCMHRRQNKHLKRKSRWERAKRKIHQRINNVRHWCTNWKTSTFIRRQCYKHVYSGFPIKSPRQSTELSYNLRTV